MLEVLMSLRSAAISLATAAAFALSVAPVQAATASHSSCFLATNWAGWKSPDPNTIYVRVDVGRVYRFDLAHPSNDLDDPSVHLVSKILGTDWICSPLDLLLYVADDRGITREPLFVKSISELTPDQVKAIPAKFRP
jgi:hypothetical protein